MPKNRQPDPKWRGSPKSFDEANSAVEGERCLICESTLLLPIIRNPYPDWRVHCNHCGAEYNIAVLLNQEAWKTNN